MAEMEAQQPDNTAETGNRLNLSQPWEGSDVTFMVEGEGMHANKAVLTIWSPVFKAMFTGSFKETTTTNIPLPEKKYSDVLKLVELCHVPMDVVTDESVHSVLPLAEEYQMDKVLDQCLRVLLSQERSIRNLLTARRYRFTRLEELCLEYVKKTPLSSFPEDDFNKLDAETQADILKFKVQCLEPLFPIHKRVWCSLQVDKPNRKVWYSCLVCARNVQNEKYTSITAQRILCCDCTIRHLKDIYDAVAPVVPDKLFQQD